MSKAIRRSGDEKAKKESLKSYTVREKKSLPRHLMLPAHQRCFEAQLYQHKLLDHELEYVLRNSQMRAEDGINVLRGRAQMVDQRPE